MYASEEIELRRNAERELGGKNVKNYRPKAAEMVIEYPEEDINPDDTPF
jgi:hypothetical protein